MSEKNRISAIKRWQKVDSSVRSAHASRMAFIRHSKQSKAERTAESLKMLDARWHTNNQHQKLSTD